MEPQANITYMSELTPAATSRFRRNLRSEKLQESLEEVAMFNLTREERRVLIFLFSVVLVGIGMDFAVKVFAPVKSIARLDGDFGKIDLNSADVNLLKSVPGIGEKLAQRIVELRKEKAGLCDLEQLKEIKGLTGNKFNKIKNYLVVR